MFSSISIRGLFARGTASLTQLAKPTSSSLPSTTTRTFTTTSTTMARKAPMKSGGGIGMKKATTTPVRRSHRQMRSENYKRIAILKQNMFSPAPPPLRMARQRHLRHWTIHRAWMLFRRQQEKAISEERDRMHAGMYNACEELRKSSGPEGRGEGYLYRVAMEKKGVWGMDAVPIEYARFQTDSPANKTWNHDWKR